MLNNQMSERKVSTSSSHVRKGFLTGITMAELMLLIIFVLLLALVIFQKRAESLDNVMVVLSADESELQLVSSLKPSDAALTALKDVWEDLIECVRTAPNQDCSDRDMPDLASENAFLREDNRALKQEVSKLRDAYLAGETPICTYEVASSEDKLHGSSVALGSLWVRADSITLLEKNDYLYGNEVVDKAGVPYDPIDALIALAGWEVGREMTIAEFREMSGVFEQIGNIPVEHRQNCRFVMNYYIDVDEKTFDIFQNVVQRYFFTGKRLRSPEERLY